MALGPAAFCRHAVRQRLSALPRTADDRQDDPPEAGRHPAGLEHLHAVFPDDPPSGLRLHSQSQHPAGDTPSAHGPRGPAGRAGGGATRDRGVRRHRLVPRSQRRSSPAGAGRADAPGRRPVLRGFDECAPLAEMVRQHGPPGRQGSLLPLRRQQPRQPPVAAVLSVPVRAVVYLAEPGLYLVRWLCRAACPGRGLHRHGLEVAANAANRRGAGGPS